MDANKHEEGGSFGCIRGIRVIRGLPFRSRSIRLRQGYGGQVRLCQGYGGQVRKSILICLVMIAGGTANLALGGVADAYLDAYLAMFPTRATQAGNHAFDNKLEDFSAE